MAPENAAWETIWLGDEDTTEADGWLPAQWDVKYNELSVFEGKVTFGAINKDSDDIISSYVMSDFSGGGQIDLLTGADQSRYRHAIADTGSPGALTLPQYVQDTDIPGSGTTYPAYYIGDVVFGIRGTNVYPWNEDTDTWGSGVAVLEPTAKPTMYNGQIFIPNGSSGYTILSGSTPTVAQYNGTAVPASAAATTDPDVIDFEVWDDRIWALTTTGCLAYSFTGATNTWNWFFGWNEATNQPIGFDDSRPPKKLFTFADNNGDPILHACTTRAVYRYNESNWRWEPTTIQFAPHPDFGTAVAVWRPGEDLHIGVGLQKITYTAAGVIDPDQGLSRNDGMPYGNLGKITDFEPETSRLYTTVSASGDIITLPYAYASKFGTNGSGDTNFNAPKQIARDSSGNYYIADYANDRVKKHDSSGTFVSNIITSVDQVVGVCVDSSGNIYITYTHNAGLLEYKIRKYNSAGVLQWTAATPVNSSPFGHLTTDSTHVYVAFPSTASNEAIYKLLCSDGSLVTQFGSFGTGDGEYSDCYGIAYNTLTGTLFVADQGNDRVQEITTTGVFVRKWGSSGTGDGQFQSPTGIAADPVAGTIFVADSGRDDIQQFTPTGAYMQTFGAAGTGNGQFANPNGLVVNSTGLTVAVVDEGNDRVQLMTSSSVNRAVPCNPSVMYWTGLGWHGAWELDDTSKTLTWGCIQSTSHDEDGYCYWFGCTDGKLRRIPLRRTFHNPRAGWQAGFDKFAPTGYIITSRFDALMSGFYKKASRLVVYMDNATGYEKVTVSYKIDNEGDAWTELGEITSTGRTILTFGNDGSGFSWGERFNWIQFRFDLERRDVSTIDKFQTPVIAAVVLNYTKIPQQARTFSFTIPFPKAEWNERSGSDIEEHLSDMLAAESYLKLVHRDQTYRGQLAAVAGITSLGQNYYGGATVNFIELRTAD
jgi:hypothetical protein